MGDTEPRTSGSERNPEDRPDHLTPVYEELRRLAGRYLRRERTDHTLQPTALVHEAYVKLAEMPDASWNDSVHFRAVASSAMRQILVDHAKRRSTRKRGGDWLRITFDERVASEGAAQDIDVLALDEAMKELSVLDERKSKVVELRFFGGLTCDEAAQTLSVSSKTAEADWYMARAWLRRHLGRSS